MWLASHIACAMLPFMLANSLPCHAYAFYHVLPPIYQAYTRIGGGQLVGTDWDWGTGTLPPGCPTHLKACLICLPAFLPVCACLPSAYRLDPIAYKLPATTWLPRGGLTPYYFLAQHLHESTPSACYHHTLTPCLANATCLPSLATPPFLPALNF